MNATQTRETVQPIYTQHSIKVSKLQNMYLNSMEILGKDHEATKALWNAYVVADEEFHPWSVLMGQISMQEQYDSMSDEEMNSFNETWVD